ncbi:MAG TPA: anti-sigma factor [Paracoccaceae bacterium]|nr:anti-sigma factor [Paracoccaceae bacterium]
MTERLTRDEEDSALAGEYVLGVLDAAERASVERRIRSDKVFAAWVQRWETDLSQLDAGFAEAPAPNLLPAIEARLFGRPDGRRAAAPGWWRRFLTGGVTAGVFALILVALVPPAPGPVAPAGPVLTAALAAEGQALAFAARWDGAAGELVVTRTGGDAAAQGQVHELWVIAGQAAPVSLGLLEAAELRRALPELPEGAVLAVSLEPSGGSPTGAPTGPVLVTGVVGPADA